jgi:hypothetical protein
MLPFPNLKVVHLRFARNLGFIEEQFIAARIMYKNWRLSKNCAINLAKVGLGQMLPGGSYEHH